MPTWLWLAIGTANAGFTDQVTVRPELTVGLDRPEPNQRSRLGFGLDLGWQRVAAETLDAPVGLSYGPFARFGLSRMRAVELVAGTRVGATRTTAATAQGAVIHRALVGGELETGFAVASGRAPAVQFGFAASGPYSAARLATELPLSGVDPHFTRVTLAGGLAIPVLPSQQRVFDKTAAPPPQPGSTFTTTALPTSTGR